MVQMVKQEFQEDIPLADIQEHPDNPRKGDDAVVKESVNVNGFFGGILIQRSTGYVIAGNTRYRVMKAAGEQTVPGFWMDVDDETATRIMLVDNRASDLAFYDDQQLFDLLQSLEGLEGTGYDRSAFELLLQTIEADSIVGNVRHGAAPEERIDEYEDLDVRSIILPYSGRHYEEVARNFAKLRDLWDYDTNAEVARRLVQQAVEEVEAAFGTEAAEGEG